MKTRVLCVFLIFLPAGAAAQHYRWIVTYDDNPTVAVLTVMGAVIGTAGAYDPNSESGVDEVTELGNLTHQEKCEALRKAVTHWTGRFTIIPRVFP